MSERAIHEDLTLCGIDFYSLIIGIQSSTVIFIPHEPITPIFQPQRIPILKIALFRRRQWRRSLRHRRLRIMIISSRNKRVQFLSKFHPDLSLFSYGNFLYLFLDIVTDLVLLFYVLLGEYLGVFVEGSRSGLGEVVFLVFLLLSFFALLSLSLVFLSLLFLQLLQCLNPLLLPLIPLVPNPPSPLINPPKNLLQSHPLLLLLLPLQLLPLLLLKPHHLLRRLPIVLSLQFLFLFAILFQVLFVTGLGLLAAGF